MLTISIENPRSYEAIELLHKSCAYIHHLYPEDSEHTFKLDLLASIRARFVIARNRNNEAIGCGAFEHRGNNEVELKHIYINEKARGLGCGKALVKYLEQLAFQENITRIVLETGPKQPAALGLYRSMGYQECEPYLVDYPIHAIFMHRLAPVSDYLEQNINY
jgi:putative acetyltransferase